MKSDLLESFQPRLTNHELKILASQYFYTDPQTDSFDYVPEIVEFELEG